MNSCRCGTKIRPSDPPVRNAKYMHHQKPPPAPVKRVSLAPLTAFKWIRILHRCWVTGHTYDEALYLKALQRRGSPLLKYMAAQSGKPATKAT